MALKIVVIIIVLLFIIIYNKKHKTKAIDPKSYKEYSKFLGNIEVEDENYNKKINTIIKLINNDKLTDINLISKKSNCSYHECILKIKFLKAKGIIRNYYIDEQNGIINSCSSEDRNLINKYSPYIYTKKYQLDEIVDSMPNTTIENRGVIRKQILEDLIYLDKKDLLNGINIDTVDERLIYYEEEQMKKKKTFSSIECPSCGALNDIPKKGKSRCEYCNRILEDKI